MAFTLLGVLLLALKLAGLNPVADWSWFIVLAPFALAMAWWAWSDSSGRSKRLAMQKDRARKNERRRDRAEGMGLQGLFDRSVAGKLRKADEKAKAARQRQIDKVESERERRRQANRDSILMSTRVSSQFDSRFDAAIGAASARTATARDAGPSKGSGHGP